MSLNEVPNSPLETVILDMLSANALPTPSLQAEIRDDQGFFIARVDFVYPDEKLVVEGHSRLWHEGLEVTKRDLTKHDRLEEAGYRIVYVTWADATQHAEATAALIRRMLEQPHFASPRRSVQWG